MRLLFRAPLLTLMLFLHCASLDPEAPLRLLDAGATDRSRQPSTSPKTSQETVSRTLATVAPKRGGAVYVGEGRGGPKETSGCTTCYLTFGCDSGIFGRCKGVYVLETHRGETRLLSESARRALFETYRLLSDSA